MKTVNCRGTIRTFLVIQRKQSCKNLRYPYSYIAISIVLPCYYCAVTQSATHSHTKIPSFKKQPPPALTSPTCTNLRYIQKLLILMLSYWDKADGEEMSKQAVMSSATTLGIEDQTQTHTAQMRAAGYQTHTGLHSGGHGTEQSSLRDLSIRLGFCQSIYTADTESQRCARFLKVCCAEVTKPFAILDSM